MNKPFCQNKLLVITRNSIPYIKELRQYAGSVTACILMQQLEYHFNYYQQGFYKFLEPCRNTAYKQGFSWVEELGFSKRELKTALDCICIAYKSKGAFTEATNKFVKNGKEFYYCSYYDRKTGLTWYYRNEQKLNELFELILNGSTQDKFSSVQKTGGGCNLLETTNRHLLETTNRDFPYSISKYKIGDLKEKTHKKESERVKPKPKTNNLKQIPEDLSKIKNNFSSLNNKKNIKQEKEKLKNKTKKKTRKKKNPPPVPATPPLYDFAMFWNDYPKKIAKQEALKAWNKIKPDLETQKLIKTNLDLQKKTKQWQTKRFIPYASTYLNGRRWQDLIEDDDLYNPDEKQALTSLKTGSKLKTGNNNIYKKCPDEEIKKFLDGEDW